MSSSQHQNFRCFVVLYQLGSRVELLKLCNSFVHYWCCMVICIDLKLMYCRFVSIKNAVEEMWCRGISLLVVK